MRTRFAPEPNGAMHLGHLRALQFSLQTAAFYGGTWSLRFDDSNPSTAGENYTMEMLEILSWLGHDPPKVTFTSSYFRLLHDLARYLIEVGLAYVCD